MVNYVRKIVAAAEGKKPKNTKVGHTGTLDPFATGLLVLLIGKEYTRRAEELTKLDKTYELTMRLGETSTTGDPEGEIKAVSSTAPTEEAVLGSLERFRGPIEQVPPAFSAIKVNGQRAYKLARAGQEVVLAARPVTIRRLELITYNYPEAKLVADVSSGTYIRTLTEDIGAVLGTGAYTSHLRRLQVGNFDLAQAITVEDLVAEKIAAHLQLL